MLSKTIRHETEVFSSLSPCPLRPHSVLQPGSPVSLEGEGKKSHPEILEVLSANLSLLPGFTQHLQPGLVSCL